MYLFTVLTMKHLGIPCEVYEELLLKFLNKTEGINDVRPYYVVKELGRNGDNPHYNVIEKTNSRSDNRRKQYQNWYKKMDWKYGKITIKTSTVSDLIGLIGDYLEKEENRIILAEYNFMTDEIKEKVDTRKSAMPYPKQINKKIIPYEQAPNIIYDAMKFIDKIENPVITRYTFAQAIAYLDKNNFEMKQVLNNITHIYIRLKILAENDTDLLLQFIHNKLDKDLTN